MTDVPPENTTVETNAERNVTTYLVPTENLPLTQMFRDVGVPDALVDKADQVLRPIVDAGYLRHDQPGDTRPYLYDGKIHRNVQSQQQVREPWRERSEKGRMSLRSAVSTAASSVRPSAKIGATVSRPASGS